MGTKIDVPEVGNINRLITETETSIRESEEMLFKSRKGVKNYLAGLNYTAQAPFTNCISALEVHRWLIVKEKAIFTCLN